MRASLRTGKQLMRSGSGNMEVEREAGARGIHPMKCMILAMWLPM